MRKVYYDLFGMLEQQGGSDSSIIRMTQGQLFAFFDMCDVLQLLYSQPLGLVQLQQHCLIASPSQLHRLLIFYDILTSSASNDCSD